MTEDPAPGDVLRDAAVVLGVFLVAGVLAGVLWPHLVGPVRVTRNDVGIATGEVALSHRFDNDAWYSVLAGSFGLVLGVALSAWRRANELVTLLVVVAGALLASWVSARVGTWLGPGDPQKVLAHARIGASALDQVEVSSDAAYLVWPIAALVGCLIVLWSPPGQRLTRRRGDRDGETSSITT